MKRLTTIIPMAQCTICLFSNVGHMPIRLTIVVVLGGAVAHLFFHRKKGYTKPV